MNKRDFIKQKYIRYFINIISKQNSNTNSIFQKFKAFPQKTPVWQLRVNITVYYLANNT